MTARRTPLLGAHAALVVLIAVLATANVLRSTAVPSAWHLVFNLAIGAGAVAVALLAGLGAPDLGLTREAVGSGLRWGAMAFAAVSLVVVALGLAGVLTDDDEVAGMSAGEMLVRVLVVIPLGTVLVEELAFRGTLHGLLSRVVTPGWTFALGAVLFGLWHVFPAWRSGGATSGSIALGRAAGVAGTFAATTVAGLAFIWLRVRSRSLVAPALAHLATNSVTFAVAWALR